MQCFFKGFLPNDTFFDVRRIICVALKSFNTDEKLEDELQEETMEYLILDSEIGVINEVYPYGDIRRYGGVGDGVTSDQTAFLNAINSVGKVTLESKSYRIDAVTIYQDNIEIIGAKMPDYKSNLTALEFGTILLGSLVLDGSNLTCSDLGVDCGLAYTNEYTGGMGGNAFVAHNSAQLGNLNTNNHFRNIIGLIRVGNYADSQAAYHAVLLESLRHGSADNIIGVGGWFGVVLKVMDFSASNLKGIENDTCSVYLKSNTYGPVERVNINNVITINDTARGYVGFMIQASDAVLSSVNASNIINYGGITGTKLEGETTEPCIGVNIIGVTCENTVNGIQVKGGVFVSIVDDINVNNPSSGVGLSTGNNTVGVPIHDLQIGSARINAPNVVEAINQVVLTNGVKFNDIYCTVQYVNKGTIDVTGRVFVGDYFGKLSANRMSSDLQNGWTSKYGQEVGLITKNGRTKGFGRLSPTGATSDVFFNLEASSASPDLEYYTYALGFDGATSTFGKVIPVIISGGTISIPNRNNYVDSNLAWIDLCSVDFPTDIDAISGV